jgi:hypothetical protein
MSDSDGAFARAMDTQSDPRAAIIDTPADTRPWLAQLKNQQVQVVIRYLARGWSSSLPYKRIAGNGPGDPCKDGHYYPGTGGSEAAQLLNNGFGILLVYEYGNSDPRKFLFGLDAAGKANTGDPSTDHVAKARAEADADADAANMQTAAIGQSAQSSPIYFTIDFDLLPGSAGAKDQQGNPVQYSDGTPVNNDTVVAACAAYFQRLQQRLGSARLGLYGNGFINQYLRDPKIVTYSWIAQSPGFTNTAQFLRTGPWHLFQQSDRYWFGGNQCPSGLDVDTDIQNPRVTDIGAFAKSGSYLVDPGRTRAIFNARAVATKTVPIYTQKDATSPIIQKKRCKNGKWVTESNINRNNSVRVLSDDGTWLSVDVDEDGVADGYVLKAGNFVPSIKNMPDY